MEGEGEAREWDIVVITCSTLNIHANLCLCLIVSNYMEIAYPSSKHVILNESRRGNKMDQRN